jgi:kynurenine 3-monooxygenase
MVHDVDGSTALQPYGKDDSEVIYSVSRGGLNNILLDACDQTDSVQTIFGASCSDLDLESGTITYEQDSNLHRLSAECLFGCDGAGSIVRRSMQDDGLTESTSDFLEHGYKELTIPGVEGRHQLANDALHIWPRKSFMLIALPNLDGTFTLTLFMPMTGPISFESFPDSGSALGLFEEYFDDILKLIPDLASDYDTNPVGSLGTVRCKPWSTVDGRTLLIGDAAHAVVPFFGQGMNCSFEDCSKLIEAMSLSSASAESDWVSIVRDYEQTRKPDADAIATMALENYVEMRDSVSDPLYVFKKEISRRMESLYPTRFIPRYSMVTFHRIRYSVAMERGAIQETILRELAEGATDLSNVDWPKAGRLVEQLSILESGDGLEA